MALDTIADLGARNVLITQETACFALVREERRVQRFRASIPRVEPVAPVGAGDVLLAGYLSERFNGRPVDDALRTAVGCAAASVVELGAGRFDPREAARLAARRRGRRARARRGLGRLHSAARSGVTPISTRRASGCRTRSTGSARSATRSLRALRVSSAPSPVHVAHGAAARRRDLRAPGQRRGRSAASGGRRLGAEARGGSSSSGADAAP